jgi:hypothetical protein
LFALYEYGAEEDRMWMRFEAGMHGINVDKIEDEAQEDVAQSMLFRDPKDYEKMSKEEREELTEKMMGYHKGWVRSTSLKGK